jgi:hypothetical protein
MAALPPCGEKLLLRPLADSTSELPPYDQPLAEPRHYPVNKLQSDAVLRHDNATSSKSTPGFPSLTSGANCFQGSSFRSVSVFLAPWTLIGWQPAARQESAIAQLGKFACFGRRFIAVTKRK